MLDNNRFRPELGRRPRSHIVRRIPPVRNDSVPGIVSVSATIRPERMENRVLRLLYYKGKARNLSALFREHKDEAENSGSCINILLTGLCALSTA